MSETPLNAPDPTNCFQFVTTEDGSLSARIGAPGAPLEDCSEAMHSLKGAFSETVYIYGSALTFSAENRFNERVLSMGLGLGYVELLASATALKHARAVRGESFEIIPALRENFSAWLSELPVSPNFSRAYNAILQRTALETGVEAGVIKGALADAVANGAWKIRGALEPETTFGDRFGCICFDAFSSKSTPDLWNEDFLKSFLKKTTATEVVLSTYACTGALKRALKSEGFLITIREGFASKRDSTFAVRQHTSPVSV